MSSYRCAGCRDYFRGPAYRKVGLSSVCSDACLVGLRRQRTQRQPQRRDDVPEATRQAVSCRDGQRCRYCGGVRDLHEHHIRYRSEGVDHSEDNLIVLCREHHDLVHRDKRRWQPVCQAYIAEVEQGRQRFLLAIDREVNAGGEPPPQS